MWTLRYAGGVQNDNKAKFAQLDDEITLVQMNLVTQQNLLGWTSSDAITILTTPCHETHRTAGMRGGRAAESDDDEEMVLIFGNDGLVFLSARVLAHSIVRCGVVEHTCVRFGCATSLCTRWRTTSGTVD